MEEISIIIPFYNGEKYLKKCLDSIVNQTYSRVIIYCIDDGSTDNSRVIVEEYMRKDERIHYYYKKNGGVSSARNYGIQLVKTKWITFVDVDDTLPEDAIQNYIVDNMSQFDIIIGKTRIIESDRITISRNIYEKTHDIIEKDELYESIFLNKLTTKYSYVDIPFAKLYSVDFIRRNNNSFPIELKYGEDVVFNIKAVCMANHIKFVDKIVYNYLINTESVSNKFDSNLLDNYNVFLDKLEIVLKDLNLYDSHKKEWDYFVFRQLIKYCRKYFFNDNNKNTKKQNKSELTSILKLEKYTNALKDIDSSFLSNNQKIVRYLMLRNDYNLLKLLFIIKRG